MGFLRQFQFDTSGTRLRYAHDGAFLKGWGFMRIIGVLLCGWVGFAGVGVLQAENHPPMDEYDIKALFLLNFTRYVTWPQDAFVEPNSPFTICVMGQDPIEDRLEVLLDGRTVDGRPVQWKVISEISPDLAQCHLIYIPRREQGQLPEIRDLLENVAVLLVGEHPSILDQGGMIHLVPRGGRVRFDISLRAANSANLRISANLLSLADEVHR